MIDIHCHILPFIDDGAKTIEESIEMARIAAKDGIRKIVATPHVGEKMVSSEVIKDKTNELNSLLIELFIPIAILPGAEIIAGMPVDSVKKYSINNNGYVLIEFPHSHLPHNAIEILQNIISEGLKPIIAHPERNPSIFKKPDMLINLVEKTGVGVQITASSLSGDFGRKIRSCSQYLLKKGAVDIIASDAHSAHFRTPKIFKALKAAGKIIGRNNAQKLVYDNPEAVINGETF